VALQYVDLIVNMTDGTGSQLTRGMAVLAPSAFLTGSAGSQDVPQAPVGAQFDGSAFPQVPILATDNADLAPSGWGWDISFAVVPGNPSAWTFFAPAGPVSFTCTDASPAVFTFSPTSALTSLPDGTGVQLSGGSLPGGFEAATAYYVVNPGGYTFELAAAADGTPLASTGSGSGQVTVASYLLSSLTPVSGVTAMQPYMPLPSGGTPSAGDVLVATGAGQASEWTPGYGDIDGGSAAGGEFPANVINGGNA
jgi:hypothetical protein